MFKVFSTAFAICLFAFPALAKTIDIYETPQALPEHVLKNEQGENIKLGDFKGKFVIAVFWSRNCAVCVRDLDILDDFSKKTEEHDIKIIPISPESDWGSLKELKKFLTKYKAPDLDIYTANDNLTADFKITTTPYQILINPKSQEIGRIRGNINWDKPELLNYFLSLKEAP